MEVWVEQGRLDLELPFEQNFKPFARRGVDKEGLSPGWRWDKFPSRYAAQPRRNLSDLFINEEGLEPFHRLVADHPSSVVMTRNEDIPKLPDGVTLEYGDYFLDPNSSDPWVAAQPRQIQMFLYSRYNEYTVIIRNPELKELVMRAFRMKHCLVHPSEDSPSQFHGLLPELKDGETMLGFSLNNFPFLRKYRDSSWRELQEYVDDPTLPKDFLERIGYTVRPGVFPAAVQPGIL